MYCIVELRESKVEESTVVAILSVIASSAIAAFSLWLNYKDRSSPHRQSLYEKQLETYEVVAERLGRMVQPCLDFIASHNYKLTSGMRAEMRDLFLKHFRSDFFEIRGYVFLPNEVTEAINQVLVILYSITAPDDQASKWPAEFVQSKNPYRLLNNAENSVYRAIRKAAGIEPLSTEIRKVTGAQERERE
jgi:hypothetical protein